MPLQKPGKAYRLPQREYELTYRGKTPEEGVLSTEPGALTRIKSSGKKDGWANLLISGDNLHGLCSLVAAKKKGRIRCADGSQGARLVYIDPPFATNLEFRGRHRQKAYKDKMIGAEFVEFLRTRLILLRELLTDDGSIFVHLDWKKAHYIKVVMDEVFGEENFLNDIIWSYGGRGAKAVSGQFSRNHDIILWYKLGARHVFNQLSIERRVHKKGSGFKKDEDGRWFKTSPRGDYTDESVSALAKEGRIYRTRNNSIRIKYFLREDGEYLIEDKLVGDVWDDIPDAMHLSESEKTGYPTQKPEALLSRIIKSASMPGDIVLDAFAGAGTTLCVAEKLGRRWVGMDSGALAIHTIEKRLLTIKGSRQAEDPKLKYGRGPAAFELLGVDCGCAGHENRSPEVRCAYSIDDNTGECVVKIERFSSPGGPAKGTDALSTVALDLDFNGEVFNIGSYHTRAELEERGFELRFPVDAVKGKVMLVFADIYGNEKWFLGELL